ncbi:MAG: hypothetical protein KGQ60_04490 [Planctomycetes bacterium]|nr:hypothetical protein [Planctomycetota bacterium]
MLIKIWFESVGQTTWFPANGKTCYVNSNLRNIGSRHQSPWSMVEKQMLAVRVNWKAIEIYWIFVYQSISRNSSSIDCFG